MYRSEPGGLASRSIPPPHQEVRVSSEHLSDLLAERCLRFVEEQYNLPIGNAQNTQLARAIATGAEKGIFVLPKGGATPCVCCTYTLTRVTVGPAGKVKLPPKNVRPVDTSASKEVRAHIYHVTPLLTSSL